MWKRTKNFLGLFLPVPARSFHRQARAMKTKHDHDMQEIKDTLAIMSTTLAALQATVESTRQVAADTQGIVREGQGEISNLSARSMTIQDRTNVLCKSVDGVETTVESIQVQVGTIKTVTDAIHNSVDHTHEAIETLQDTAATTDTKTTTLHESVTGLETTLDSIQGQVGNINTVANAIHNSVDETHEAIETLQDTAATTDTKTTTLHESVTGLEATLDAIQGQVGNINTVANAIHNSVDHTHEAIETLQDTAATTDTKTTTLTESVAGLETTLDAIQGQVGTIKTATDAIHNSVDHTHEAIETLQDTAATTDTKTTTLTESVAGLETTVGTLDQLVHTTRNSVDEVVWSSIFQNTIQKCDWLTDKNFSPGRWAAGYPFLYILFRTLRDAGPTRILELGLGETTRLISQYCRANPNVEHLVVESDSTWVDFFRKSFDVPANTEIIRLPLAYRPYKTTDSIRVYEGFHDHLAHGEYDLICIDGPMGADMRSYDRIDSLSLLPDHLAGSFTIIVDDYNRATEQNMVSELLSILNDAGIPYVKGIYRGSKHTLVICSEDNHFLTSL
ncbi:MAG: hypothetical protein FWF43_00300 [Propionibacteriaceae bacterium]|nr:hypothetical protein [Propionibacteriaceae bacterium]